MRENSVDVVRGFVEFLPTRERSDRVDIQIGCEQLVVRRNASVNLNLPQAPCSYHTSVFCKEKRLNPVGAYSGEVQDQACSRHELERALEGPSSVMDDPPEGLDSTRRTLGRGPGSPQSRRNTLGDKPQRHGPWGP